MRDWADVAVLAKPKNLQGGFVAQGVAGLPFLLSVGTEVAFVPPAHDAPRRARVTLVQEQGDTHFVMFDAVTDIDCAELLAGCHCLVCRSDLPEAAALAIDDGGLVGWSVYDAAAGHLGIVGDMLENPGQVLLSVVPAEADSVSEEDTEPLDHDILIPLVDEFIVDVDEDACRIDVDLPAGLLDL